MPGKIKFHQLTEKEKEEYLNDFYSMVSSLENRNEIKNFFKDLLTPSEMVMICRRIQIAKLLLIDCTHEEIRRQLGVGFNTINQVDKWLNGEHGGYKKVIKKYDKKKQQERLDKEIEVAEPYTFDWLRKKYPLHFLIANVIIDRKKFKRKRK